MRALFKNKWRLVRFARGYLLLLPLPLSRFSCVRLYATPQTAAHQAPLSLGLSRQEHWSSLPLLLQCMKVKSESEVSCSILSDSLQPHGLQLTRLLRPWNFSGKRTGVGWHCLLRRGYLSQLLFEWAVQGLDWNRLGAAPPTGASGKTSVEKSWKQSNYIIWLAIA